MRIFNVDVQSSVSDELVMAIQGVFPISCAKEVKRFPEDYLFAFLGYVKREIVSGEARISSGEIIQLAEQVKGQIEMRVHQEIMRSGERPIDAD